MIKSKINRLAKMQGFSLIELLVVIAIIAMGVGIMLPNFMGARERTRDAKRKTDIVAIQKAMELYKIDQNPQVYPTSFPAGLCGECWLSSGTDCEAAGVNLYIRNFPCDPLNPTPYVYKLDASDSLKYSISSCLENEADPDKDAAVEPTCAAFGNNASYTIHEP